MVRLLGIRHISPLPLPFTGLAMAPTTPRVVIPVDLTKKPWEQKRPLHNRWHPDIPPVAEVKVGEIFRVEMIDWTGGFIGYNDSAVDMKTLDLSTVSFVFSYPTVVYQQDN